MRDDRGNTEGMYRLALLTIATCVVVAMIALLTNHPMVCGGSWLCAGLVAHAVESKGS